MATQTSQIHLSPPFCFSLSSRNAADLVYVRVVPGVCQDVEARVHVVEQVDDLDGALGRGVLAAEGVEAHDAAEEDADVVVALGRHGPLVAQLVGHRRRQDGVEQPEGRKRKRREDGWMEEGWKS